MAAMFPLFKSWQRRRILRRELIPLPLWQTCIERLPILDGLDHEELQHLRELATLFLHEKSLEPTNGLQLSQEMRVHLAAQAALPILHLGIDWYAGWSSLVLYPADFITRQVWTDEAGVVHSRRDVRSGEAWERGPVVLSWADVAASGRCDGYNTVIHEFAHKLDGTSGKANGCPALHGDMRVKDWRAAFEPAFEDLCRRAQQGEETALDPYATEGPQEFFAVMSEYFFELPHLLQREYPAVYTQLRQFYRQDPGRRLAG